MSRIAAIAALSVLWPLSIGCLAAQSDAPATMAAQRGEATDPPSAPANEGPSREFPLSTRGSWDLSVWARQAIGNSANGDVGDEYLSMAGFRTGYVLARPIENGRWRGSLEYFFDVIPVFVLTKPKVVYGGGLAPVGLKWNFLASRHHPYFAMSGGGIFSTRNVPVGNTDNFNFTVAAEGGVTITGNGRHALVGNVGFFHLSNALMGATNPSFNGLSFGVAYHWYKCR
jgi:hypothetical protein